MMLDVLIVEDEALIAMDLEIQVAAAGHVVVGAVRTADEAVAQAASLLPDVVLMDLRLAEGSSGIDAGRRIYEDCHIRCIYISGNLDAATQQLLEGF